MPRDILREVQDFDWERNGGRAVRLAIVLAVVVLGIVAVYSSYYQVEPDEVGIFTRFGKYVEPPAEPGPHLKLPFGIDRIYKVPVKRQLKMEFGFRTALAGVRTVYAPQSREALQESAMLTGDLNVAEVEWVVQYQIRNPYDYLFKVDDVEGTLRAMSSAAMRQVVGDRSVTEILTVGREAIAQDAKDILQQLCDRYEIGVSVQQLVLQDVNPPDAVKPSFNEVNQALQEKERSINHAWAEYNQVIPRAAGEADQALRAAEGYALERVNRAKGDAARFEAVRIEYEKAPEVTRTRLYLEAMAEVLPRLGRKVVVDGGVKGLLPMLRLDSETPAEKR